MSKIKSVFIGGVVGLMTCCTGCESKQKEYQNWEIYGGTKDNISYSKLAQIDTSNVNKLEQVWEFSSKDHDQNTDSDQSHYSRSNFIRDFAKTQVICFGGCYWSTKMDF